MKFIEESDHGIPVVELTRRNLEALLMKLDIEGSACTLVSGCGRVAVKAVENDAHYKNRPPGVMNMGGEAW